MRFLLLLILSVVCCFITKAQITIKPYFPEQDAKKIIAGETNTYIIKGIPRNAQLKMNATIKRLDDTTYQMYKGPLICNSDNMIR